MSKKSSYNANDVAKYLTGAPDFINLYISDLEKQISNLSNIGLALSKEKDMSKLLEMILLEAKRIANSDGGTLYMMTDDQRLRFEIMMTDSLDFHMGGTSGKDIPFYPIKLYTDDGKPNETMIAAFVALTGQTVNIKDAYVINIGVNFSILTKIGFNFGLFVFRKILKTFFIFLILFSIFFSESIFLVSSFPDGSPILVVPPPKRTIGLCPCFCKSLRHIICNKLPT